jgi:hypothetical protein
MRRRERELRRLLIALAERTNAHLVALEQTNGGHIRARFDRGGPIFASATPSDARSDKNLTAQAKRMLR